MKLGKKVSILSIESGGGDMPKYQHKRSVKTLLIDPQMQKEYTFLMVIILFISAIVISVLVNWTIRDTMMSGPYRLGKISPYEVMSSINYLITVRVTIALLVTIVVSAFLSIKFLHRVGGPIYRFRVTLKQIAKGQIPSNIKLRTNDFYKDIADEINKVLELMRSKKEKKDQIVLEIQKLPLGQLPPETSQSMKQLLDKLKQEC